MRWQKSPGFLATCGLLGIFTGVAHADCPMPANAIEAENCLPGNPASEWDVVGAGDPSIQGFSTETSVNRGQTVEFKINSDASGYSIDIFRLGYYGGDGARNVATALPSATLPQSQPPCLTDSSGLVDCGNWAVSASWTVPANAVSGIYIARLVRADTSGASHVVFIVRDDGGSSDILFQTADTTWQAYNRYGGNSLYQGTGPGSGGRAYKVSYNRPMTTREYAAEDFLFNSEYPMVRWLERNGYNVSYFSGVDTDRLGPEIARHKVFLAIGHDEYWSKQQRLNVEAARDRLFPGQAAPVHLAFLTGNDVFWKTRWEASISPSATAHRTLVCYKETHAGAKIDPSPEWTGTWRDARPINPEGPNPENALTGTLFTVSCCAYPLELRAPEGQMRFWRNTPNVSQLTGTQVWTGPAETIGYEWNEDIDNGVRPPGLVRLSATTRSVPSRLLDNGSTYGPGNATHNVAFHKRPSGALVFSAGTIQWSWGLDGTHDRGTSSPSPDMQQATVNVLADMGAQPVSLDSGLVLASASTDVVAPTSAVTFPANNAVLPIGVAVTIQGTAADTGGRVGGVEVSVDGGLTWHPAVGRDAWSYEWTPANGTYVIRSRGVDDSANIEIPGPGVTVFGGSAPPPPPPTGISIWGGTGNPTLVNQNDGQALGLGVKFRSSSAGSITALRFYKGNLDTGTHVGRLWTANGTLLATATFTGETASGWQQVQLSAPVFVNASTTYVASYHSSAGYYVVSSGYFAQAVVNGPLTALADGTDGPNGLYRYGASAFPNLSYQRSNYWVDVVFIHDLDPPTVTAVSPPSGASEVPSSTNVTGTFNENLAPDTVNGTNVQLRDPASQLVPANVTWNPVTRTAMLDPTVTLAFASTYTATLRGGPGGLTDTSGNALAGDVTWTFTTGPPETTPPTVVTVTPSGSVVVVTTNVTATFSEALDPNTVNGTTIQLRDGLGSLVAATVAWNAGTLSVTLDPTASLVFSTVYTATARGGSGGVTDLAGNPLAADVSWTFTTQGNIPDTRIWPDPVSPTVPNANDATPIELGVKFRSSAAGYITGIRFHKGSLATGSHTANLWSSTGTLLATAPFANETPSGWQEVALPTGVQIAADTTYVASFHSAGGWYPATRGFFAQAATNGPLTALADGTDGPNGLYLYGASAFPVNSSGQSNYWVDVVFNSQPPKADITPPTVVSTTPAAGATGVLIDASVVARFSEPLAAASVSGATMQLRDPAGALVPSVVTWDPFTNGIVLDPVPSFGYAAAYTATVKGGAAGVKDRSGNALAGDVSWTFTAQPPPEEGPGGPILVIGNAANLFSRYYVEILAAEGLNAYKARDLSVVDPTVLAGYDVAILGQTPLTAAQVTMLTNWVNAGGSLIAMRPDAQLASLLGLTPATGTLAEAYLQVQTGTAPGQGIVGETMQFHGTADRYTLGTATAVATLFSNATTATTHPAVTLRSVGLGHAAAFTYDLARSIVYTRQGNPAWAGDERDGITPKRSDDLFFGAKAGDVQPDWVNLDKVAIPQADEQQRLLANLILHMNRDRKPLPRFWYFPFGKKAVVVMTSDNHGNGLQSQTRLNRQLTQDPPGCDVTRWECIRSSMYLYLTEFSGAASYQASGFEIGPHVTTNCGNYTPASLGAFYSQQMAEFATLPQFAALHRPATNRTHCIVWSDWATQARVELEHGIRLDTNYYYWPASWVAERPGHFTGSGMPMRFADLDGSRIDVYQAATQITDESGQAQPFTIDTLLDRALGPEGFYAAVTANIHSDYADESESDAIVESAKARAVPVVSARQMLTWLDGRNGSSFEDIAWSGDVLTFGVTVGTGTNGIQAMLPRRASGGTRLLGTLTRDGTPVSFIEQAVKGIEYVAFAADPGAYAATYALDIQPPVLSGVSVSVRTNGSATMLWTTDENSGSVVQYGTDPGALAGSATVPTLVTAHRVVVTGLSPYTTYYYRVVSADPAGNSATSPVGTFAVTGVDTTPPAVALVRPRGGERVFAGSPYNIDWTATDNVGVTGVDVEFSSNGGTTFTGIANCTGLAGTAQRCVWAAPGPVTSEGRVRVTARDAADLVGSATSSAAVNVVAGTPSLTLTAPTTAVSWRIGSTQNVTFNHNIGSGQLVTVELSRDGGASWTTINSGAVTTSSTSGTIPWVVSGPVTAGARIRVAWSGNPAIATASPVSFAIIDRITITAPNTALIWTIGSTRAIRWNHNLGAAATVNIDVSRDGGATWAVVAAGVPNGAATTGTYNWIVTAPATTTARVRVSSAADPTIFSTSPVDFIVSGVITLIDPTASSVWSIGSTRAVTWTHNMGAGQTFALDLSTDNGVTFPTSIATAVAGGAADGSYSWVVPGPLTATARLRVRWSGSSTVAATSGSFDMVNQLITLTSPNTAVSWGIGATRAITWTHNLGAGPFEIALSTDGGLTYPTSIATAAPAGVTTGSYSWIVSGPVSTTARIRVSSTADPAIRASSAVNFTLTNPVLTLTSPTTAVNWAVGITRAVTWNQNLGTAETVDIEKSIDGGATWTAIATGVANASTNGTYSWLVSGPASAAARIRVRWTADASLSSQSPVNFTIGDPFVTVTSPNTAVAWLVGSAQNVTFNHNLGTGMVVNVDVSRDGGATFSPVTAFTTTVATTGTVPWVVTGPATAAARIRVTGPGGASDTSDVDFAIQRVITLTSPNTAVSWGIGATRALTWTHNLGAGAFDIALSTDGGASYSPIATSVPGTATSGSYLWVVSGPVSTTARVRVSSASEPLILAASAVNFTIAAPIVTVTAPNTAVTWAIGTTRAVTWSHNLGNRENVNIDASTDGGLTWTSIATGVANGSSSGTFNWLVPGPPSASARIRVRWAADATVASQSAVSFTIADPVVTVTAPNTAVTWTVGSTQNVTFTHNLGTGVVVSVDVSRDGGATFAPVTSFTTTAAATGTVPWVVTAPATTQARMRLTWAGGATDTSDVDFVIQ